MNQDDQESFLLESHPYIERGRQLTSLRLLTRFTHMKGHSSGTLRGFRTFQLIQPEQAGVGVLR